MVDGVTLSNPSAISLLGDLESIEILKGPQGMLFGKNASAGVISINTRAPQFGKFEGFVNSTLGSRDERTINSALNIPISDSAAIRLTAGYRHLDGAIDRAQDGKSIDEENSWAVRGKLRLQPTDALDMTLGVSYSKYTHYCCSANSWRFLTPGSPADIDSQAYGIVPGPNNTKSSVDYLPTASGDTLNASLLMNYDLGGYKLTSISGYERTRNDFTIDVDGTAFDAGQPIAFKDEQSRSFSQELRLSSPVGGRFDFILGGYYYHADLSRPYQQSFGPFLRGLLETQAGLPPGFFPPFVYYLSPKVQLTSVAGFFEGNLHLTDKFTFTAGARFTHDSDRLDINATVDPVFPYCGTLYGCFVRPRERAKRNNISWRITPQFNITPTVMIYASIARGYKGPCFNTATVNTVDQDVVVMPEKPLAMEVGVKARFLDNRIQVVFDLFHTKYKGYQAQVTELLPSGLYGQGLTNGELTTKGAELSILAEVAQGLRLGANASYIDTYYNDLPGVVCYFGQTDPSCALPGNVYNAKGHPLFGSPRWSYSLSADYERPGFISDLTGTASLNWRWNSEVGASNYPSP